MFLAASSSLLKIATASFESISLRDETSSAFAEALKTRSTAHRRFTPVGRVLIRRSAHCRSCVRASAKSWVLIFLTDRTRPKAPTTPIKGAPRTFIVLIAPPTCSTLLRQTYTSLAGRRVWSMTSNTPSRHLTGSRLLLVISSSGSSSFYLNGFIAACPRARLSGTLGNQERASASDRRGN